MGSNTTTSITMKAIEMVQRRATKLNINKDDLFVRSHLSTSGHRPKIYKQYAKKLLRINTFSNRIVNDWNELPSEVVEADSINSFKNRLDKHWIEKVYETPF